MRCESPNIQEKMGLIYLATVSVLLAFKRRPIAPTSNYRSSTTFITLLCENMPAYQSNASKKKKLITSMMAVP